LDISAVWTGTVMMIYGGNSGVVQSWGNLYNPATDVWTSTSTVGAVGRARYTLVWTGKKVIVVGGQANYSTVIGDTGLYDPVADTWTTGAAAYPRQWAHSVWTGKEMVVRGGLSPTSNIPEIRGQAYNPQTNQWRDISQVNAPAGAYLAPVVWTGEEMMVWGGGYSGGNDPTNAAGRYNPATDTWAALSLSGAPTFRDGLTSVWTGTEMVVWGGQSSTSYPDDGGRYFPASNTWLPMAPAY
jgi:N-acetylneuraminic acid mutarotase